MKFPSFTHIQDIGPSTGGFSLRKRRPLVLVIEDDQDNLLLLYHLVSSLGCDVLMTRDGQTGLAMVKDTVPDLILLDIVMPHLSGFDVLQHLRQIPQAQSTMVIAVTGLATPETKQQLLQAGCCDYLCKPYLIDKLESLIYKYLLPQSQLVEPLNLPVGA